MSSHNGPSGVWLVSPSTIAGAGAGLVSSIITCPLDVVKTRLQAQKAAKGRVGYLGISGVVRQIWTHDGIKGYYRGLGPTIFGYIPTWAIYFSVYDGIKGHFGETYDGGEHHSRESMGMHLTAAMTAGATATIATNPMWVVKTRFMTQSPGEVRYRHTADAFLRIYRGEGIQAFYRGLLPSLVGVSHVAVQFPLYEELKLSLAERQNIQVSELSSLAIFVCSSISKMTASLVTYPHEVIRTRLQIDYFEPHTALSPSPTPATTTAANRPIQIPRSSPRSSGSSHPLSLQAIFRTCAVVYNEGGWKGMYRGLSINLLRTVPNSAITLLTYEQIMRYLHHPHA